MNFHEETKQVSSNPVVPYYCKWCKKLLVGTDVFVLYAVNKGVSTGPYWVFCNEKCCSHWKVEYFDESIINESLKAHIVMNLEGIV